MAAETDTLTYIGIGLVVLVVMALVIYSILNFDDIKQIAQEVFHIDTNEEINTKTEDSVLTFSSNLDACVDGDYNPASKDNCFCFQGSMGSIAEGSYISIQNKGSSAELITFTENGEPLSKIIKSFKLGLLATSKNEDNYQLGCVFPSQYFIIAKDEDFYKWDPFKKQIDNNWYVKWLDDKLSFLNPLVDDYTFGFYRDDSSSSLNSAPMLYRIDSTHYCLVTKLIDEPVEYSSSEFVSLNDNLNLAPILIDDEINYIISTLQDTEKSDYYASVQSFLLNDDLHCNK